MAQANVHYDFDYVVIGVGGIGSAAVYWLKRLASTKRVLGIERFELGHVNGGSQDHSRMIRKTYRDSKFSELASMSFQPWFDIEEESGLKIYHKTGELMWTTPEAGQQELIEEHKKTGIKAGSQIQEMDGHAINHKWPGFQLDASAKGIFDPDAGFVDAIMGNAAHQQCAIARGAEIWSNTKVNRVETYHEGGLKVHTTKGTVACRKVIVCAGAWINDILASFGLTIPVKVSQENVTYIATPHLKLFTKENFPIFTYIDPSCFYYALPVHGIPGFKIGLDAAGPATTGDTRTFVPDPEREKICTDFIKRYLPKASGRIIETKTCLYTMTYDRTFVIDTLATKNHPDVIVCCGAGHAYKFAALFGKILSEMAIYGSTQADISSFCINRPAITDPKFKPNFHPGIIQNKTSSKI